MFQLKLDSVRSWQSGGGLKRPSAFNTICPECGERGTFSVQAEGEINKQKENHLKCVWMRGGCPTCKFMARFIQLGEHDTSDLSLYINPSPNLIRQPIPEPEGDNIFTGRVYKAYLEAVRAYNTKHWPASAVMCGKALEGLTKALLPQDKQNLSFYQRLKELPEHLKLNDTISGLTDGIRRGRNIAAHFDEFKEIDEPTAAMLIELLESVIEYLFLLPSRIEKLDAQLEETGQDLDH
ncbi:MAG: DUF4145 domain-containing protein [Rhodothermaceae bacterium]|nr:DUF4145 domain-containing protein [Rhodothermaceae bacterium]